ncbi:ufm1-specific protease 1 isoform X2 [Ambystoma mexicanum]|uniref:ufm1-specific protease 1 isoform X2 n=1 Tax=Ambystoma mexicanum TaxID=8296 RepID=UPI0037E8A3DD
MKRSGLDVLYAPANMDLIRNIHEDVPPPTNRSNRTTLVHGDYMYYHYGCDGVDDRGWGCGYRTLQTMCSWVTACDDPPARPIPTLCQIQEALVEMQDKPSAFTGSRSWIGSVEVALCMDYFYDIPCRIRHVRQGDKLPEVIEELHAHFQNIGAPVMMGGDTDNSSKGIMGVCSSPQGHYLLVLDPHFYGKGLDRTEAQQFGWVQWRDLDSFQQESFYNFCIPQSKGVTVDSK